MAFSIRTCVEYARNRLRSTIYWAPGGYRAESFWRRRHQRYQFDMRGVGNCGRSHAENVRDYQEATRVFLELCRGNDVDFPHTSMLDIGCGTGHYAEVFQAGGGTRYLGVDIADALFPELESRHPGFAFRKLDISEEPLDDTFDLITMIDVTQHVTNPDRFSRAMQHVQSSLPSHGVFIVTSWLDDSARKSFYEVSRPIEAYAREFPGYRFSPPVKYRDKYMFAIRQGTT